MKLHVTEANVDEFRLFERLVSYYFYDLSEVLCWSIDSLGQYRAAYDLPSYWEEKSHHPLLIRVDDEVAGFIMVRPSPTDPDRREVAELFVMRKFRKKGVGKAAALWLFNKVPGKWVVRVRHGLTTAQAFWYKLTNEYANGNVVHSVDTAETVIGPQPMTFYHFATTADSRGVPKPVPVAAKPVVATKATTRGPGLAA
jgi:predicted acetyltransferase